MNKEKKYLRYNFIWLIISLIIVITDQITKLLVIRFFYLTNTKLYLINKYINIILTINYGAAFNFLSNPSIYRQWMFIVLGIFVIMYILYLLYNNNLKKIFCIALSLIIGGTIGNITDRILYGYVIDFLDIHCQQWHWPAFNIADSALTIGTILLFVGEIC